MNKRMSELIKFPYLSGRVVRRIQVSVRKRASRGWLRHRLRPHEIIICFHMNWESGLVTFSPEFCKRLQQKKKKKIVMLNTGKINIKHWYSLSCYLVCSIQTKKQVIIVQDKSQTEGRNTSAGCQYLIRIGRVSKWRQGNALGICKVGRVWPIQRVTGGLTVMHVPAKRASWR